MAQSSPIPWFDVDNTIDIIEKIIDLITIVIISVLLINNSYVYEWKPTHNPLVYAIMSIILEGLSFIIGFIGIYLSFKNKYLNRIIRKNKIIKFIFSFNMYDSYINYT
jgi:hypothetical protein